MSDRVNKFLKSQAIISGAPQYPLFLDKLLIGGVCYLLSKFNKLINKININMHAFLLSKKNHLNIRIFELKFRS